MHYRKRLAKHDLVATDGLVYIGGKPIPLNLATLFLLFCLLQTYGVIFANDKMAHYFFMVSH